MTSKSQAVKFILNNDNSQEEKIVHLNSGRNISIRTVDEDDHLEISDPSGNITLKLTLTESGPVITAEGANLNLKSVNKLSLNAKKINIKSEEETLITTKGNLDLQAKNDVDLRSKDADVTINGKFIRLN